MNDEHNKSERYASHSQKAAYYLVWLCRPPRDWHGLLRGRGRRLEEGVAYDLGQVPGEGRVCLGAAVIPATATTSRKGVTLPHFDYTGKTVVGPSSRARSPFRAAGGHLALAMKSDGLTPGRSTSTKSF